MVAGGAAILLTRGTWWVVIPLIAQAFFVNALFAAMHESVHYGSFKTRWMADVLAFFSGAAILNNAGFYRHYHMAHHRYTQDPARDPELITSGTPRTWGNYLLRVSSLPFFVLRSRDILLFPFGFRGDVDYIHPSGWVRRGAGRAICSASICCCSRARSTSRPRRCCGCGCCLWRSARRCCGSIS